MSQSHRPPNFRFIISYVVISILLLAYDVYSYNFEYRDVFSEGIFSVVFFLALNILFSIGYITSRFRDVGGVFSTRKLFLIPLIVIYGKIGLWSYILLLFLSHITVEREKKPFITYSCAKSYVTGSAFYHLFVFLSKDQPIFFDSNFLIPYFSTSIISYLIDVVDHYAHLRFHLVDRSKIWRNVLEIERAVIPNYLLSVLLAAIIIMLYFSNNLRYVALALPLVIFAVAIYRKFYAIYVEDRATKIEGEV